MNEFCPVVGAIVASYFDMEDTMYDRIDLCMKLTEVMPELGVCGVDIDVTHDDALKAWRVTYNAGNERGLTFLDDEDVDRCMIGKECLSLGMMAHEQLVAGS